MCIRDRSKRVKSYDKRYTLGTCIICKKRNIKVSGDLCKKCDKLIKYDIDTLHNAMLYLKKSKS